ncbi:MAG: carboxylating nicotinate-nucleotide diphosphorylase [Verrucomicrobiales bacterium]|nr:carboxylating nicotinate-nucleotide diphosphorylase [Verrucomicrobiales bacterium]
MIPLSPGEVQTLVRAALSEDLGAGDVTTASTIPETTRARGHLKARQELVVAGLELAAAAFRELAPKVLLEGNLRDGDRAERGSVLLTVEGPARALLTAERVALNCLQRLSGIATFTAAFVRQVHGTRARILDTRKTTPGWRRLDKYAVSCGGGVNHRQRLDDLILIKDNHLAALIGALPNPIAAAVARARQRHPYLKVEVEADRMDQVRHAVEAGADIVLLDNMTPDELRQAVAICQGRSLTEASGGIRLENVRAIAETGVDFISIGALTHSAPWVDIGLDFEAP